MSDPKHSTSPEDPMPDPKRSVSPEDLRDALHELEASMGCDEEATGKATPQVNPRRDAFKRLAKLEEASLGLDVLATLLGDVNKS